MIVSSKLQLSGAFKSATILVSSNLKGGNKPMRKITFMILIVLFVFTLMYAQEKGKVTWWYETVTPENLQGLINDLVKPFENSHPGVEVEITVKDQLREVLRAAIVAGEGPDIVMTMGPAEANRYAKAGLLLPLDEYIRAAGLDSEIPSLFLDIGKVKGKVYSIPKTIESMGIIYNKSLFEENGWKVPTNREEWVTLCEKIKRKGIIPVAAGNSTWRPTNEHYVTVYLNHYAGPENVYKALTGQMSWSDPIFVKAIEMFKNDFKKYWPDFSTYSTMAAEDIVPMVAMRQAAMLVIGTWGFQWMGDPAYWPSDDEWGWAPFPSLNENVPYPIVDIGIGTTLSVNKNSEHPDLAADFLISMFKNKEGLAKLQRDFPGEWVAPVDIPSELIPEEVDPVFVEHIQTQYKLLKEGNYGYTTWTFLGPETWQWCYEGIEKVWLDQMTPEEYMKKWDEIFKKELEEGIVPPVPPRR